MPYYTLSVQVEIEADTAVTRAIVSAEQLRLPACPTPRPGDQVVWYQSRNRHHGILVGHQADGRPYLTNQFNVSAPADSFDCIRLQDESEPLGPNWHRLQASARICRPSRHEKSVFDELLQQRTPPGPQYVDLVREIWHRGYEVFVVGGTVRDVIAGIPSKDVDLSTTMPLERVFPLARSMYGEPRNLEDRAKTNGHLRLGGKLGSTDPFVDLSVFKHSSVGTAEAIFGDSFEYDMGNRDFACNSVYYDPINDVYIDPSGFGIDDASTRVLRLVTNPDLRTPYQLGQIVIRFFKFLCRGFAPTEDCKISIATDFLAHLASMDGLRRGRYIRGQLLGKTPNDRYAEIFEEFRAVFIEVAAEDQWLRYVEPLRARILS